ncbi:transposase family protein [Streptomyces sp. NPDC048277]|uniref:transposase family protein n=1 Tax=Streptomyces sp. NPDC048277 TaxID=3155027 RepID=UPI0033D6FBE6
MTQAWARAACSRPALSGISGAHLGDLNEDRLLVTLAHPRLGPPHAALAELYRVDRSAVSVAVRQVRPLLAARGFAVPDRPGVRIRTLEDLFAYADAEGVETRIDGTEVQVRRPKAGRPGRKAFISGEKRQNTIKTTTFSDGRGRTPFSGVVRPGRMHDQTAVRTEGTAEQLRQHPPSRPRSTKAAAAWQASSPTRSSPRRRNPRTTHRWASITPGASSAAAGPPADRRRARQRRTQAVAPLQRFTGRRETYPETHLAIAFLVSDRVARRATRHKQSTELVLARPTAC